MRIEEICNEKNISYKQLAEKANMLPEAISRLAAGKTNPTLSTLSSIAKALDVHITELFDRKEPISILVKYGDQVHEISSHDMVTLIEIKNSTK